MDKNLLLKEQEFYEINKKLDLRTRELLEKMDEIKSDKVEELFTSYSAPERRVTAALVADLPRSKSACVPSSMKFTPEELRSLNVPEDINHVGAKGFIHFLKSKVKQLQFEADKLGEQHKAKCEEVKRLHREQAKLVDEKEKHVQQANVARCHLTKLETQLTLAQSRLQAKEGENLSLAREVDGLGRELKAAKVGAHGDEVRCQRALEELAKVKTSLRSLQQNEKDLKQSHGKYTRTLNESIKRLERQKSELLAGFKKQHALIANLKQQKLTLTAMKFHEKAEADFIKLIVEDQGDGNGL